MAVLPSTPGSRRGLLYCVAPGMLKLAPRIDGTLLTAAVASWRHETFEGTPIMVMRMGCSRERHAANDVRTRLRAFAYCHAVAHTLGSRHLLLYGKGPVTYIHFQLADGKTVTFKRRKKRPPHPRQLQEEQQPTSSASSQICILPAPTPWQTHRPEPRATERVVDRPRQCPVYW